MIGNYGVPDTETKDVYGLPAFFESSKIHAAALIVADYAADYRCGGPRGELSTASRCWQKSHPQQFCSRSVPSVRSHWNAKRSLSDWLASQGVPGITGVDTR